MTMESKARVTAREALSTWAHTVGALVEAMKAAEVPGAAIHALLDRLGETTACRLRGADAEYAADVIGIFRTMVKAND